MGASKFPVSKSFYCTRHKRKIKTWAFCIYAFVHITYIKMVDCMVHLSGVGVVGERSQTILGG